MIAIVESGSTKSDWRIIDDYGAEKQILTAGFNPYHTGTETITRELLDNKELSGLVSDLKCIYFYGAGCSTVEMNAVVSNALKSVFPKSEIEVDHDLLGAALGAGQGEPCIVCILGTGSNACYFDGQNIYNGRPSLGYILGDEGSGAWFGKHLLADYLHGLLPQEIQLIISADGLSKEGLLNSVYREPRPNTFLASFMPSLGAVRENAYTKQLLEDGFTVFLERYVCAFDKCATLQTHFVGSVAFHFADELRDAAKNLGLQVGNVIQHPVSGLVEYHRLRMKLQ